MIIYPAQKLIAKSLYTAGVVAKEAQTPSFEQINEGLDLLNELLDWSAIDTALVPYYAIKTDITTVPYQESYFLENVIEVEDVAYIYGTVRFPTAYVSRKNYFTNYRVENLYSLMGRFNFNRTLNGGDLSLYPIPNAAYPLVIDCKLGLTDVSLSTNLRAFYDGSYIVYLHYALADAITIEYDTELNPRALQKLAEIKQSLYNVSPPDLSNQNMSMYASSISPNWSAINISPGFWPNG